MFLDKSDWERFQRGEHFDIYKKLGGHPYVERGVVGTDFAVWAPEAQNVSVIGEFNAWNPDAHVMDRVRGTGFFEARIPQAKAGQMYKFQITTKEGRVIDKADPFAFSMERRPGTASIVDHINPYRWSDDEWLTRRAQRDMIRQPIFVYEVHVGSWMRHKGNKERNPEGFYNYRDFAVKLADYVLKMGYTHVQLIGIMEYQNDFSWGYQVTDPYAVNSRYGKPRDFMYFVNYLHNRGIGVILDWIPAHFSKDRHGLKRFDGSHLFEPVDRDDHPMWGTKVYDYSKGEVRSFMIANALYWINTYHLDGLRVDAVDSLIHKDFGRAKMQGDNHDYNAIRMVTDLNWAIRDLGTGVMTIAEETTAHPKLTALDGLGFTFAWNVGWSHDFLEYVDKGADKRKEKRYHDKVNFSMVYAYNENYMLVLSHDSFGHANKSMYARLEGTETERLQQLRCIYMFMMCHPGKKLMFMGLDFAQKDNWATSRELDWYLLKEEPQHLYFNQFMQEMIHYYRAHPALYDNDLDWSGFHWVNADDCEHGVFSFERHSQDGTENLLCVFNFLPEDHPDYRVGVEPHKRYTMIFNSINVSTDKKKYKIEKIPADGRDISMSCPLKAYEAVIFKAE